jgi:hypothetical protein
VPALHGPACADTHPPPPPLSAHCAPHVHQARSRTNHPAAALILLVLRISGILSVTALGHTSNRYWTTTRNVFCLCFPFSLSKCYVSINIYPVSALYPIESHIDAASSPIVRLQVVRATAPPKQRPQQLGDSITTITVLHFRAMDGKRTNTLAHQRFAKHLCSFHVELLHPLINLAYLDSRAETQLSHLVTLLDIHVTLFLPHLVALLDIHVMLFEDQTSPPAGHPLSRYLFLTWQPEAD